MVAPSRFGDLILDGVAFRLASPLQIEQLSTYPGKVVTGDYSKDSDPRLSSWIVRDLTGGHGVADIQEGVDQGRCRWATLNTRYPGQFVTPYLATQYTAAADTTGARPLGDLYESGVYRFYAAYGTKLVRWDESTLAFSASLGTLTAAPVGKGVEFKGTGTRKLFVPMGASGYATWDGAALATSATPLAQSFLIWDDKLLCLDTDGQLHYSTDGSAFTSYSTLTTLAKVDAAYVPRSLVSFYDQGGNPAAFVVTNRRVFAFDASGPKLYPVTALDMSHPYGGLGAAQFRANLYVSLGMGVRRYTGDVAQPIGLDRDDGLPLNYRGRVLDLEPENNGLFALCVGGESGATSYAHLQVWTEYGWHPVWVDTATSTTSKTTWARVSEAQSVHRLWWGDGSGNLRTIKLPTDDANPRTQIIDGVGSFATGTFTLHTGRFDASQAGVNKVADHMYVKLGPTAANVDYCDVYYRINGATSWTLLKSKLLSDGGVVSFNVTEFGTALANSGYQGLLWDDIEFRLDLINANATDPFYLEYFAFYFMKVMPPGRAFTAQLDLSHGNLDQSAQDLAQKLDSLLNAGKFFEMQYRYTAPGMATIASSSPDFPYIRARLTQVSGVDGTGQDLSSLRTVALLEVPTASSTSLLP